jgi:hypothetical protein
LQIFTRVYRNKNNAQMKRGVAGDKE